MVQVPIHLRFWRESSGSSVAGAQVCCSVKVSHKVCLICYSAAVSYCGPSHCVL